jgi:putative spermidine/putrescine transport system ATP-binding protein
MEAVLELRSVSKHFATHRAVTDVSLAVRHGEFFSLLGPSGCGKTTTLRMVAGFELPTAGEIRLNGSRIEHLPPYERNVNTVFQSYALFPHLTVRGNVEFGLRRKRADGIEARVAKVLEQVRLSGKELRLPSALSGGERQRVALARSLVMQPDVLLLDEPLSALDPFLKIRMRAELKKLQASLGITFVHVTHSQEEAMALADLVVVMNEGRIEQAAPPREVFERPATAFVARFMGEHNVITGRITGRRDEMVVFAVDGGGSFAASGHGRAVGDAIDIAIRTDRVRLGEASSPGLGFTGLVANIEYRGASVKLSINGAGIDDFTVIIDDSDFFAKPIAVGDAVPIAWTAEDVIVLGRLHA